MDLSPRRVLGASVPHNCPRKHQYQTPQNSGGGSSQDFGVLSKTYKVAGFWIDPAAYTTSSPSRLVGVVDQLTGPHSAIPHNPSKSRRRRQQYPYTHFPSRRTTTTSSTYLHPTNKLSIPSRSVVSPQKRILPGRLACDFSAKLSGTESPSCTHQTPQAMPRIQPQIQPRIRSKRREPRRCRPLAHTNAVGLCWISRSTSCNSSLMRHVTDGAMLRHAGPNLRNTY